MLRQSQFQPKDQQPTRNCYDRLEFRFGRLSPDVRVADFSDMCFRY
jgi:hypothetical protein